jgi:hypothetical protein
MNFKQFLVSEGLNLDQFGPSIDRVFAGNKAFQQHASQYLSGKIPYANLDIRPEDVAEIPRVEKTGVVEVLLTKRNPIYMKLNDGTEAHFTYDEWNRMKDKPALGKTVSIIFQRSHKYKGPDQSKIEQVIVKG